MLGATGAVGNHAALALSKMPSLNKLTLLGRREAENVVGRAVVQHEVDIFSPKAYEPFLKGHDTAICTLGVGQPSKMSKEDYIKIDKMAVLEFASACKKAGITHFELLSSVGVSPTSSSFYLRAKGELEDGLKALGFERLSLFHPSMIMTPTNRYGFSQALVLAVMPFIDPLLVGSLNKYRSISCARLGTAMANNLFQNSQLTGVEILHWREFIELSKQ
ncbi:NAD-dependent epimerase/dehydratase family protein [Alginatibacterium sediminis]|uniref:NAD-dependent epimerase/dehydratase family protein n=2 Tax=Alginatibacterium sediminis TaxID=2164068 RepID=A0A420EA27_9ALTE|nr:NAD-dependent epimerase/dehydratase family protein [Alginatibacterium sediminis]